MRGRLVLAGVLMGTMAATSVLAAASGGACLQRNRLQSWRAVNDRTLVMMDNQYKTYTVHLKGRCSNVTYPAARLVYRTWQNLACLESGDIFSAIAPGLGAVTCAVASVEAGAPQAPSQ